MNLSIVRHNANNEPCDALIGPCCCGAWHDLTYWDSAALRSAYDDVDRAIVESRDWCGMSVAELRLLRHNILNTIEHHRITRQESFADHDDGNGSWY